VKALPNGDVDKFKARLVVRGFTQRPGIDYLETFSPVAKATSIRAILALAAKRKMKLRHIDFETAYLNGDLEEAIWMTLPQDSAFLFTTQKGEVPHESTVRLLKGLYGLKQAGRLWNRQIHDYLVKIGFERSRADPCIYTKSESGQSVILGLYVDDCLVAYHEDSEISEILAKLKARYAIKDLGEPQQILGLQIERTRDGSVKLHQEQYIENMLKSFGMEDCNPVPIPHAPGVHLSKELCPSNEEERKFMQSKPYAELVGSLNWAATMSRPDIAQVVSKLCRFISDPGPKHWSAAKHVLKYLKGSKSYGLFYKSEGQEELSGYHDSDWAGDKDTRRSTTGFGFFLAGSLISWRSKLQTSVSLSSTEAEYMACCFATREAVWLRRLLQDLGIQISGPTVMFQDSTGCKSLSENWRADQRTKHIDVQYHFVREQVEAQTVSLSRVSTENMIADALTKPVPRRKFEWCREHFGMTL
jgi:hypothetical protein